MSVSHIEAGKESLAPARAYAWAEVLEVRRDAFYLFVTGHSDHMDPAGPPDGEGLLADEAGVLALYRKLPPVYQRQVRDLAQALGTLARGERRKKR